MLIVVLPADKRGSSDRPLFQICAKVGHTASRCFVLHDNLNKTYNSYNLPSPHASPFTANYSNSANDNAWLLDIGTSHHIAYDLVNVPNPISTLMVFGKLLSKFDGELPFDAS